MNLIEFDFYIAPDGKKYNLNDGNTRFLMSKGGEGMPPLQYLTERGPFQHGVTALDFRLNPRLIQAVHRRTGKSREQYWSRRADLLDAIRPNRRTGNEFALGQLRKILPDGQIRDIDVSIDRGPEFGMKDPEKWDEWSIAELLRFVAFDPTFYNPTQSSLTFTLEGLDDLVFPFQYGDGLGMIFGLSTINSSTTLSYTGTWLDYPIIEIDGPLESPIITNTTTSEVINLGYNIPSGRTVTIDLRYGKKTIQDDLGQNLIGVLDTDSDLGEFHIAPDPEAPDGENVISVQGGGAEPEGTAVRFLYNERYIGI